MAQGAAINRYYSIEIKKEFMIHYFYQVLSQNKIKVVLNFLLNTA